MIFFLATLIPVFLVTASALPSSLPEEFNIASLPSLNSPFSDFSPPSAATADEPNSMSTDLDQSLNFLAPSTLSSQNANLDQSLNFPDLSTLSPQTAQLPYQEPTAMETTTINQSATSKTGKTDTDSSISMCPADGSTGQNVEKRDGICRDESYFLLRPKLPKINYAAHKGNDLINDEKAKEDKEWLVKFVDPDVSPEERLVLYYPLATPGENWCGRRWEGNRAYRPFYTWALCCLGPKEFINVPTLGNTLNRRQSVILVNVFNCLLFLLNRPYCTPSEQRYCCHEVSTDLTTWGFKGLDCVEMDWNNYPAQPPSQSPTALDGTLQDSNTS